MQLTTTGRPFRRPIFDTALARLHEPRRFIQVLAGPRQVGKTTLARQLLAASGLPSHFASADEPALRDRAWLNAQWEIARGLRPGDGAVLVVDEIQKVTGWNETVKRLWDEDTRHGSRMHVVLLGSAPLLVQRGLSESLAGRFELIRLWHWSFAEMREAFGWDLDRYLYYGGYPGGAALIDDEERWATYIRDSLIETTISRDVLLLSRVDKPALLRQLFRLACDYSAQIVSYQKLLGQLQDAGNVTTLAHYLDLLSAAGLVTGLQKYSGSQVRQRGSSPKLLVLNTALMSAMSGQTFATTRRDRDRWGRIVESAVGAHLAKPAPHRELWYWREGQHEADFIVRVPHATFAIEVKSGRRRESVSGLGAFKVAHPQARPLVVGADGVAVDDFLAREGLLEQLAS